MATANAIAKYLPMSCTQGGADTFTQTAVSTNLDPANGLAFKVTSIQWETSAMSGISADCVFRWTITRDTKTGMALLTDTDVMFQSGWSNSLTTSGQILIQQMGVELVPEGIYIVEPTIYLQVSSGTTGLTNSVYARLFYEEVKLSEVEILRILNNQ